MKIIKKVIQENEPTMRQTRQAKDFLNAKNQVLGVGVPKTFNGERSHLSFEVIRLAFAIFFV